MNYKVLGNENIEELEKEVNEYLQDGYKLVGGPSIGYAVSYDVDFNDDFEYYYFIQGVIKYEI